jgi:hypothetical protein
MTNFNSIAGETAASAHWSLWNFLRSLSEAALTFVRLLPPDTTAAAQEAG